MKTSSPWMKFVKKHVLILKDCKPPKAVFRRFAVTMLFYLFAMYVMSIMNVLAGMRYPRQSGELPDIGFAVLPPLHSEQLPSNILLICILTTVVRFIFHKKGITVIRRFFAIHGITAVIRSVTLVATSYPDPSYGCQNYKPVENISKVLNHTVGPMAPTCGDLMPSGHTLIFFILALSWHKYCNTAEKFVFWLLATAGCISLIVTRLHYTNDVLIGLYVAITTFYFYNLFATDPNYRSKSAIFSWVEADLHVEKENPLLDKNNSLQVV